ncbi:MAG: hypothetical protein LBR12_05465, partial [Opitutaceae bacterium]|nr:hypothetical protein [Opitutaceae bacterium]
TTLIKAYRIEARSGGAWKTVVEVRDNHQRLVRHTLDLTADAVRLVPLSTYKSEQKGNDYTSSTAHLFAFEVI